MLGIYSLIGFAMGLFLVLAQIFAWVAFFRTQSMSKRIDTLEAKIAARSRPAPGAAAERRPAPAPDPKLQPEPEPKAAEPEDLPAVAAQAPPAMRARDIPAASAAPPREGEAAGAGDESPPSPPPPPQQQSRAEGVEQALTSRWLVWLGAVAVGLSAIFLFSYVVEQGLLGPVPRVLLGLLMGVALIAGGEWTHRHPITGLGRALPQGLAATVNPDYVPQALTASGVFALYAAVFAAHALFALIGTTVAFIALAAVSITGLILALRQGWFVALLGLAGGYAVPTLLESDAPAAIPVFLYMYALTAGCLAVMRYRDWPFLAIATLAGSAGWPLLWMAGYWSSADQGTLSLYAVATAAVFVVLSIGLPVKRPEDPATAWLAALFGDTSGMGFVAHGAILVVLALLSGYNVAAFVFLALYAGLGLALGLYRAAYESLGVAGAIIVAAAFLLWPQPDAIAIPEIMAQQGIQNYGDTFGPIRMPAEFLVFARAALFFSLLYGVGGFVVLNRAAAPPVWAALSATMPLLLLTLAYWRIGGFELNLQWGAMAAGLSFAMLAAASGVERLVGRENRAVPLSFYAAATTAALALAFTSVLREAWLTVALSVEVLALAWIWVKLEVRAIRTIAYVAAAVVIVRLVLNYRVIDYEGSIGGLFSWVVYGYGIPAAAFFAASRLFGDVRRDPLAALCQAGAAGFGFLMVAMQLRAWTSGSIFWAEYRLFDQAVQSVWWLIAAGLLLRREITARSQVALYGGRALLALAAFQIGVGHLLGNNPLISSQPVGEVVLFNLLGLAYLVPAALCWLLTVGRRFELHQQVRQGLQIAAGVLVFVYLTMETRRVFQGSLITISPRNVASSAEIYAYSAIWILYSLILLAVGVWRQSSVLRYTSLSVLIVTLIKVFLYDMSDLTGLFRVASLLGLGLTLIGVGYVYQRFVFRVLSKGADEA